MDRSHAICESWFWLKQYLPHYFDLREFDINIKISKCVIHVESTQSINENYENILLSLYKTKTNSFTYICPIQSTALHSESFSQDCSLNGA